MISLVCWMERKRTKSSGVRASVSTTKRGNINITRVDSVSAARIRRYAVGSLTCISRAISMSDENIVSVTTYESKSVEYKCR